MTWVAKRQLKVTYGDERITIEQGERLDDSHSLPGQYPEMFEHVADTPPRRRARSAPAGPRRRRMTAEQQQAIRTARLAELAAREASGWGADRTASQDAEDVFWRGVDKLLGNGPDKIEREGAALMDHLEATQANAARDEIAELSAWIDR